MPLPRFVRTLAVLAATLLFAPLAMAETGDISMGNPKAKVTMIEYASVTCPHCARINNNVLPAFKAKYIDTGKVLYIFR